MAQPLGIRYPVPIDYVKLMDTLCLTFNDSTLVIGNHRNTPVQGPRLLPEIAV